MAYLKDFLKRRKYVLACILALATMAVLLFRNGNGKIESYAVGVSNVEQSMTLSGKVETNLKADLGFAVSGRIQKIYVKNDQSVARGQVLAQLEIGELLADLAIKEANSKVSTVDLKSAKDNLEEVASQENAKVANAYRNLHSEDLELTPASNTYTVTVPSIAGIYDGKGGIYKINVSKKNTTIDDYTLLTFGLEKTKRAINEEGPTILGTEGLYISFPDDLEDYKDTIWYLEIPNKSGPSYLANYNAYIEAKNDRDLKIKNAQAEYDKLLTKESGDLPVAEAEIQKIKAEIKKNTIHAPFNGKVTNIEKEAGESVTAGERVISIFGKDKLQVVLQASELDVSKILIGTPVKLELDAFKGEEFTGIVESVNSKETTVEGVPVYEAFVLFPYDERVKNGMSANGKITLGKAENVLAVPAYMIFTKGEESFVQVLSEDNKITEKKVIPGLRGSDSMVEIVSGLSEGDKIVSKVE